MKPKSDCLLHKAVLTWRTKLQTEGHCSLLHLTCLTLSPEVLVGTQEEGNGGGGGGHHQKPCCIEMGSDENHSNVSLTVWGKAMRTASVNCKF